MTTIQELESFAHFARQRLRDQKSEPSLDELFDLWRFDHPAEAECRENLAAVAEAIQDYKAGDRGRPAGETSRELREELGIPRK